VKLVEDKTEYYTAISQCFPVYLLEVCLVQGSSLQCITSLLNSDIDINITVPCLSALVVTDRVLSWLISVNQHLLAQA